jgi:capsular polysaccharide transport system permease protein
MPDLELPRTSDIRALLRGLAAQKRVMGAMFMREIQIRWGRRNLGFAWVVAEPLVFALPVLAVWRVARGPFEHGLAMIPFLWSGYLPILAFRHMTGHAIYCVRSNGAVLFHPLITPLDIVLGRCGLEAAGNLAALVGSFGVFYALGAIDLPRDPWVFIIGYAFLLWWCAAVALIVAAASEYSDFVEHIWMPISYLYVFFSGFMYLAMWMPDSMRSWVMVINPPLNCYEIIRQGLFGSQIHTFGSPTYLTFILSILTLLGLWLMRGVRKHLSIE